MANTQHLAESDVSDPLAIVGTCMISIGQYAGLRFYLSSGCSTVEILEYDEKLCQLYLVIYGAVCHHQKYHYQ
jgi:hypothetical protein